MKHITMLTIITLVFFSLSGCIDIFNYNLFEEIDKPKLDTNKLENMNDEEAVSLIDKAIESKDFLEKLQDTTEKEKVTDKLNAIIKNDKIDASIKEKAMVLGAKIELKTGGGEKIVKNTTKLLDNETLTSGTATEKEKLASVIKILMPNEIVKADSSGNITLTDKKEAAKLIDSLISAGNYYDSLAQMLQDNDNTYKNKDINKEEVAMNAVICTTLKNITDPDGNPDTNDGSLHWEDDLSPGEALIELATGNSDNSVTLNSNYNLESSLTETESTSAPFIESSQPLKELVENITQSSTE